MSNWEILRNGSEPLTLKCETIYVCNSTLHMLLSILRHTHMSICDSVERVTPIDFRNLYFSYRTLYDRYFRRNYDRTFLLFPRIDTVLPWELGVVTAVVYHFKEKLRILNTSCLKYKLNEFKQLLRFCFYFPHSSTNPLRLLATPPAQTRAPPGRPPPLPFLSFRKPHHTH